MDNLCTFMAIHVQLSPVNYREHLFHLSKIDEN